MGNMTEECFEAIAGKFPKQRTLRGNASIRGSKIAQGDGNPDSVFDPEPQRKP